MRKVLLALLLGGLMVLPVRAQIFVPLNDRVQDEVKLDDKQKMALAEIFKTEREYIRKGAKTIEDGNEKKGWELFDKGEGVTTKALQEFRKSLTAAQAKRLLELEAQWAKQETAPTVFRGEEARKGLGLTAKQKAAVKKTLDELDKKPKELKLPPAGPIYPGYRANRKKYLELRKQAYETIIKSLTAEQTRKWKDMDGKGFSFREKDKR